MNTTIRTDLSTKETSKFAQFFIRLFRNKIACLAAIVFIAVCLIAIFAPFVAPNDPDKISIMRRIKSPGYTANSGETFILGTDSLGRDVFSRLVYGSRVSILVALSAVVISGTLGVLLGLLAGYFGGWVDTVIMRIADIMLSFPTILLALSIMAVLGAGLEKVILVLGITGWVQYGRIVRGQVLAIKQEEFILSARASGERDWAILFEHILPNLWSPVIVMASFSIASNIISEASLSFLGIGVPPTISTWGTMLADGRQYIGVADWLTIPPGIAISITVLSINILGDWIRDYIDPRLKNIM